MRSALIRLMEAKSDGGNFKSPDGTGFTLPHKPFAAFTYIVSIRDS